MQQNKYLKLRRLETLVSRRGSWAAALLGIVLSAGLPDRLAGQSPVEDPNLRAAIGSALSKPAADITASDLGRLTCLSANNREIRRLSGLEHATNLVSLSLSENLIKDLHPLQNLSQLKSLQLENNLINNLAPLAGLTNLECLSLGGSYVEDYSTLLLLESLTDLSVCRGYFRDLSVLRNSSRLTSLVLWQNGIRDIAALAVLTNLNRLDLRWNSVHDLDPLLVGSTNLSSLYLGGNFFTNVSRLEGLQSLSLLNLDDNSIRNIGPLSSLTNLIYLSLNRNPITNYSALTNLTKLSCLELRGNAITNIGVAADLIGLSYVDLAYNRIHNVEPLTNLSGLGSLVFGGNPLANHASVVVLGGVTNLWLFDNSISNADFVANLPQLNHLNLDGNCLSNIPDLSPLTNLTGLGVSRNAMNHYGAAGTLTNLEGLRLDGNRLTDLEFLTNLSRLSFLSLEQNRITNISAVAALTNLQHLYLRRNTLENLEPLTNSFPRLSNVDLRLNLLDLSASSSAMSIIQGLQYRTAGVFQCACALSSNALQELECQRVQVSYLPTNQAPTISFPSDTSAVGRWYVSCNATSSLAVTLSEEPPPGDENLLLTAHSSNTEVVGILHNPLPGTNYIHALAVTGECNALTNAATITLTVTDEVGLSNNAVLETFLLPTMLVSDACSDIEPELLQTIAAAAAKTEEDFYVADALNETSLVIDSIDPASDCVWMWLTNLTELTVSGFAASSLSFVTNLPNLTSLTLSATTISDLSPLSGLTNLRTLHLLSNPITNYNEVLPGLTRLTALSLAGDGVTNLSFAGNLIHLEVLELGGTRVVDLLPLSGLTNLSSLSLQGNPVTNYDLVLPTLTNLSSLTIVNSGLSNICFVESLGTVTNLDIRQNRVRDISCLSTLSNLVHCELSHNLLTNISCLTNLAQLSYVGLRYNLLDTVNVAEAMSAIEELTDRGVQVLYEPQRTAPIIQINTSWPIAGYTANPGTNQVSLLTFAVFDDGQPAGSQVSVTSCCSSDPSVIPEENVWIGHDTNDWSIDWFLHVTPASNGIAALTVTATNDAGLGSAVVITVTVVEVLPLTNVLGTSYISWQTSSNAPWFGQSEILREASPSAQSGSISNGVISELRGLLNGPGTLTFWWCVSSELDGDSLEFDFLGQTNSISGQTDWEQVSVIVPPGLQTARWQYRKDSSLVGGMDAGWLANVVFVPGSWLEVGGPTTSGWFDLLCYCVPGQTYGLQASTNMVDWGPIEPPFACTNSPMILTDSNAVEEVRFYRLISVISDSPILRISWGAPDEIVLSWDDPVFVLESSPTGTGPWTVIGGNSPVHVSTKLAGERFFRLSLFGAEKARILP